MSELQTTLAFTFVAIFSMVNPIGMAPVFLEKTKGLPLEARHSLAYRVALFGTLLVVTAMFAGPYVLGFFGIALPDIQVAGGLFVFYTAWQMLVAAPAASDDAVGSQNPVDIAFFPLTMPITAGAGSIAVAISLSSRILHAGANVTAGYGGAVLGICLVFTAVALCYRFSDAIFGRIGSVGTNVVTRLTAFFLLAIGVAVTWGGLESLIRSIR